MKAQSSLHQRLIAIRGAEIQPAPEELPNSGFEQRLLTLVLEPLAPGETVAAGHDRKEREIGTLLGTLDAAEAWKLHRRLQNPMADDKLATAFGRIIPQRRMRLLAFLGDPKRRAALSLMR